jgi:hypothetical protein
MAITKNGHLMRLGRETQAVYGENYAKRTQSVSKTLTFLVTDDTLKIQNTQLREYNVFCIKNGFTAN